MPLHKQSIQKAITASSSFFQSVLWKRLRQELGIVYGVQAWNYDMFSRSILGIQTSFQKEYLEKVIEEVQKGLNEIKEGKVDDSVFKAKKKKVLDTQLMQLDSPINALAWISDYEDELEENGKALKISEYLDFVEHLKFEDVLEVANEIYKFENVNIGVVSKDETVEVVEKLEKMWK